MFSSLLYIMLIGTLMVKHADGEGCGENTCKGEGGGTEEEEEEEFECPDSSCIPIGEDDHLCVCDTDCRPKPGGQECEKKPCIEDPTLCDPGSCTDTIDSHVCECPNGYSGSGQSRTDIDDCVPSPCCTGICVENMPGPGFTCICHGGTRCEPGGEVGKGPEGKGTTACAVPGAVCVEHFGPDGRYYAGTLDEAGAPYPGDCIDWDVCTGAYDQPEYFIDGAEPDVLPGAFCRNPNNHGRYENDYELRPWCYTDATNCGKWGFCDIPEADPSKCD